LDLLAFVGDFHLPADALDFFTVDKTLPSVLTLRERPQAKAFE
jgi:hypothetical protein